MPILRLAFIILACTLLLGGVVGVFFPALRSWLVQEDSVVETATAAFFLAAGVFALWQTLRRATRRLPQMGIAGVGLLGFLDEISFGERLFALDMPKVFGVKLDAAHDLIAVGIAGASQTLRTHPLIAVLGIAGLLALALLVAWRCRMIFAGLLRRVPVEEPMALGAMFAGIAVVVTVLDMDLIHTSALVALEEVLELNGAVVLLLTSVCLSRAK